MGPMLTTCPSYPAQLTKINIALTRFAIWTWGALDYNPSKLTNTLSKKLLLISPYTVKSSINWHSYCFENHDNCSHHGLIKFFHFNPHLSDKPCCVCWARWVKLS
jgi:hypothetical protein